MPVRCKGGQGKWTVGLDVQGRAAERDFVVQTLGRAGWGEWAERVVSWTAGTVSFIAWSPGTEDALHEEGTGRGGRGGGKHRAAELSGAAGRSVLGGAFAGVASSTNEPGIGGWERGGLLQQVCPKIRKARRGRPGTAPRRNLGPRVRGLPRHGPRARWGSPAAHPPRHEQEGQYAGGAQAGLQACELPRVCVCNRPRSAAAPQLPWPTEPGRTRRRSRASAPGEW